LANCQKALQLSPTFAPAYTLGAILHDCGQIEQAIAFFRSKVACDPDAMALHSQLCYAMHFDPNSDARAIREEHRAWNDRFAKPLTCDTGVSPVHDTAGTGETPVSQEQF